MLIHSETEMLEYGKKLGASLKAPSVLELLGDVGAGKTTLVRADNADALVLFANSNTASAENTFIIVTNQMDC